MPRALRRAERSEARLNARGGDLRRLGSQHRRAVLGVPAPHQLLVEVLDLLAENDRVMVRYIERGTHTGDLMGLPPTGRSYEKHGFALYRVADGRLAECWLQEDDLGFQQQLFS